MRTEKAPVTIESMPVLASAATSAPSKPVLEDVGILALVPDRWSPRWMVRHHIMARLGRYFHMVWVNPAHQWREMLARRPAPEQNGETAAYPGFAQYTPEFWLPEFYRPNWLAQGSLRKRVQHAMNLLSRRGCSKKILYLWRPEFEPVLHTVPSDLRCYHLEDEYSFSRVELPIDQVEARVLAAVNQVFILSPALMEKKGKINPNTMYLPGGVNFDAYSKVLPEPADLAPIQHPRVGYVGSLKWQIDWNLLLELSQRHSQWSFVLVGPPSPHPEIADALRELYSRRNVHFLGGKPSSEMIAYPQHFDVCTMPYGVNDYTHYIYPLKLHEYLAGGRPVVGAPIASLTPYRGVIRIAENPDQWSSEIAACLEPAENTPEKRTARQRLAREHDWEMLVRKIALRIAELLGKSTENRLNEYFRA